MIVGMTVRRFELLSLLAAVSLGLCAPVASHALDQEARELQQLVVLNFTSETGLADEDCARLADAVRAAAPGVLNPGRWTVIHQWSLPPDTLVAFEEENSLLDAARNLGVDGVVTGVVNRDGGSLRLDLRLHDAASGQVVAAAQARAGAIQGLVDRAPQAAADLLEALSPLPCDEFGYVTVTSAPHGLSFDIDREPAGHTPRENIRVCSGEAVVTLTDPGFRQVSYRIQVDVGELERVEFRPTRVKAE